MADDISKMFNPFGPTITPAMIIPTIPGSFTCLESMGANKIISNKTRKSSTLSLIGKLISSIYILLYNLPQDMLDVGTE
jgi:hypothetical protein